MRTHAVEGRGGECPEHLWVSVHAPLHDTSTFEQNLGWEAVQVGLVGCSVRPQEARDAAVTLGQGAPGLSGCLSGAGGGFTNCLFLEDG